MGNEGQRQDSQHQTRSPGLWTDSTYIDWTQGIVRSLKVISLCHETANPKVVPRMSQGGQSQTPLTLLHTVKLLHLQAAGQRQTPVRPSTQRWGLL